jgi:uncharacterized membrane protein YuzA (DUF378 family)
MVKPGINTTELALVVLTILGNVIAAATGAIDSTATSHVSWATVGLAAFYAFCRSLVKYGAAKNGGS